MRKYLKCFLIMCLFGSMVVHTHPASASGIARTFYLSSAKVYAKVKDENDVIGNAVVTCLSQVKEIDVDMYLQRAYGNVWQNVTSAYNMNMEDVAELDKSAIIYNVSPGTYRVYIEVNVTGFDGFWDTVGVGTAAFTINT